MALVASKHTASVTPAVQRREQLLRTHILPSETQVDETAAPNTAQSTPAPTVTSESAALSSISKEPLSRSQEIAKEVLEGEPMVESMVQDTLKTVSSGSVKSAFVSTASGGGGGSPDAPIYVTIAERTFIHNSYSFTT